MHLDRDGLEKRLKQLVVQERLLSQVREMFGLDLFSETKRRNWSTRGRLPKTLLEGAALQYVDTLDDEFDDSDLTHTGLVCKRFIQAFVVSPKGEEADREVLVIRYWENVSRHERTEREELYLEHRTIFSGRQDGSKPVQDLLTPHFVDNTHNPKSDTDGWIFFDDGDTKGRRTGRVLVSWRVDSQGRDYGYSVKLAGGIEEDKRFDYLGGYSGVPSQSQLLLLFLPSDLLGADPLDDRPRCLGFHAGEPTDTLDQFLKGTFPRRYFSSWIDDNPARVLPWQGQSNVDLSLPEKISALIKQAEEEPTYKGFFADIKSPKPLLSYCFVIRLPSGAHA